MEEREHEEVNRELDEDLEVPEQDADDVKGVQAVGGVKEAEEEEMQT